MHGATIKVILIISAIVYECENLSVTLSEDFRLRQQGIEGCINMYKGELHDLYCLVQVF